MDHQQLLTMALELPTAQRAEIAGRLIESLDESTDDAVDEAWSEEIRRRLERLHSGTATTISFEESRRRVRIAAGLEPNV